MTVDTGFNPANFSLARSMQPVLPSPMQGIQPVGVGAGREFLDPMQANLPELNIDQDLSLAGLGGGADGGFDWQGAMKGFSAGAQGIMGLANAYNAYKQMGLMEDQFNFARADRNQNVANQAAITNEALGSQASAKSQLMGNKVGSSQYVQDQKNKTQVSGAAV